MSKDEARFAFCSDVSDCFYTIYQRLGWRDDRRITLDLLKMLNWNMVRVYFDSAKKMAVARSNLRSEY